MTTLPDSPLARGVMLRQAHDMRSCHVPEGQRAASAFPAAVWPRDRRSLAADNYLERSATTIVSG